MDKENKAKYRICYRNASDNLRHTIFAVDEVELTEKLKNLNGSLNKIDIERLPLTIVGEDIEKLAEAHCNSTLPSWSDDKDWMRCLKDFKAGYHANTTKQYAKGVEDCINGIKRYYNGLRSYEDANPLDLITQLKTLK